MNPFTWLQQGLGQILAFFYDLVPSYGISIILLTLLVSFIMFPLTLKQTRSMRAMQDIQPQVKELQKQYKDDRDEMQKQLMKLYQERGVNPAAGCLPLIVQMPIWFALFRVLQSPSNLPDGSALQTDIAAHGVANFLGMDLLISPSEAFSTQGLVSAIPYLILVLIVMGAGYYQQAQTTRRTKANGQAVQQPAGMQTVLKIMPVFFGFISWSFPAGLVLYFATSNLFRVGQQSVIFALDDRDKAAKAASITQDGGETGRSPFTGEAVEGSDDPEQSQPKPGPSPNASKKRNKRRRK